MAFAEVCSPLDQTFSQHITFFHSSYQDFFEPGDL